MLITADETSNIVAKDYTIQGRVNTDVDVIVANVRSSIRRGLPQLFPQLMNANRVVLVGGGPSLKDTEQELIGLVREGVTLVTVNGAYHWCLERNLQPDMQIVMDARASNARFVEPALPRTSYALASQCHPVLFDAIAGREKAWIFHIADKDSPEGQEIDAYYLGHWHTVAGGTSVATRAIGLLRMAGYLRFDLFGVDSCWSGSGRQHHAYPQAENESDTRGTVKLEFAGRADSARYFVCSAWHLQQAEDFLRMVSEMGRHFLLNVHGDGLLAHALRMAAEDAASVTLTEE